MTFKEWVKLGNDMHTEREDVWDISREQLALDELEKADELAKHWEWYTVKRVLELIEENRADNYPYISVSVIDKIKEEFKNETA